MIQYRVMTAQDVAGAAELEQQCFSEPWSAASFAEAIDDPNIVYVVALDGTNVIGNCGLRSVVGEGEITNVAVRETYRGRGIATELMRELMRQGELLQVKDYTLEVRSSNRSAIALYERCGFVSEGIRPRFYRNPTEDAIIMWKRETSEC